MKTFKFLFVFMAMVFSEKKRQNAHEVTLRAVTDYVHVLMYSHIETAEAENTVSATRTSVCV